MLRWTALLALLVALVVVSGAQAARPSPEAVHAGIDATLRAELGWDRSARSLVVTDDLPPDVAGLYALALDQVWLAPDVAWGLVRPRWRAAIVIVPTPGVSAFLVDEHEGLHYDTGCYGPVEEWITQAVALDHLPSVSRKVWGFPMRMDAGDADYTDGVRNIRALSALATGSETWRDPDAWAFRDALWRAPLTDGGCAVRASLLARTGPVS